MKPPAWKLAVAIPGISLPRRIPDLKLSVFKRRSRLEWAFLACLGLYSVLCVVIYFQYVEPWIAGKIVTRIGADSDRYWAFVTAAQSDHTTPLISPTQNNLAPVTLGLIFHAGFPVMCFNILLFGIALKIIFSISNVNKGLAGFLLLLNAELLPSLTTLNKEIFALLASAMTVKYLLAPRRSALFLTAVFLVSLFARWEQAAILLLYLVFDRLLFRNHPWRTIIVLVGTLTIAVPLTLQYMGIDADSLDWLMGGANTILRLDTIQNAYGFPLVVVPKAIMSMAGALASPRFYTENTGLREGFQDPQQEIFQPLGCAAFLCIFGYALWTKRMRPSNPVALLILVTLIVTAASPFIQPRYLYGAYTMLCIVVARRGEPETQLGLPSPG